MELQEFLRREIIEAESNARAFRAISPLLTQPNTPPARLGPFARLCLRRYLAAKTRAAALTDVLAFVGPFAVARGKQR